MTKVIRWLTGLALDKYIDVFAKAEIDFEVVRELTDADLEKLGIPLGPRRKLLKAISGLREDGATAIADEPQRSARAGTHAAERRQLTVVFVDLVESTALSRLLDPEDLRDVLRGYREAVAGVIRDSGGFVAKFMGDGVMAYFGYPQASEDAAERAVRAGLRAIAAVKALPPSPSGALAARVGVATGAVVVGDIVGEDLAREVNVVGDTPNLAARLLALARPDSVVIADSTRRIVGDLFVLAALGPRTVKGLAEPILAYTATAELLGVSRFEATRNAERSQFVGRGQEVGLLLDRWEQAKAGDGQLVLLSGEAGIGKSRITETMYRRVASDTHIRIRYQCAPQHAVSPLYPALMQIANAAGLQPEDDAITRVTRLASAMPDVSGDQARLVASLLGAPIAEGSPLADLTPARRRQLTLAAFTLQLEALCRQSPVLWIVEDAHWIDPTTEELVTRVVEKAGTQNLLIVITHRPEYRPPWTSAPITTQLALNRLSRTHAAAMLVNLDSSRSVPMEAVDYIVARTDGIPLYVEELFRALCDSGALRKTATAFELAGPLERTVVPATLQDSLMARLDRLPSAKAVAQRGAAIGREFEYGLLSATAALPPPVLDEGLAQLLAAGLIFVRGTAPEVTYTFKHALVQDAAYGSMLKQQRQAVHGRIAGALHDGARDIRAELLAHHYEEAGLNRLAARWLETAGERAVKAAANQEAMHLWRRALRLLFREAPDREVRRLQIGLQQELSALIGQIEGYNSQAASELADSALEQALGLEDVELYARICSTMVPNLFARQGYDRIERQMAWVSDEKLPRIDLPTRVGFLCMRGVVHFHLGRFSQALGDLQSIALIDDRAERQASTFGGGDVRIGGRSYLVRANLVFGLQDTADRYAAEALILARQSDHPAAIEWALLAGGRTGVYGGRHAEALRLLDEGIELCERNGYVARLGQARLYRGIAMVGLGDLTRGALEIEHGLDLWRRRSGGFSIDILLMEAADHLLRAGYAEAARRHLEEAKGYYATGPERAGYAEHLRVDGVLAAAAGDRAFARAQLEKAITVAEAQGANQFRLRASRDLALLLADDGDVEGARSILAPVYAWFTEGFDTPDLKQAKALLLKLAR
jgi:class 3 adenylate cyclase/tetratricopeptide (TPR) repeat protein